MTNLSETASDWSEKLRGVTPRAKLLAVYLARQYEALPDGATGHITISLTGAEEWTNLSPVELRCAFDELPNVVWRKSKFGRDQIDVIHVPGEEGFSREPL